MNSRRVAVCGAFDIENYGDLLFPEILSHALGRRGLQTDLVRFGPIGGVQPWTEPRAVVARTADLEQYHLRERFDAIIVGGGALVHFNTLQQALPGTIVLKEYSISDTWVIPALVSARHGVPLLWNAVDVPYTFPPDIRDLAARLVACTDYICVRNDSSKLHLLEIGCAAEDIVVCPDTALALRAYFPTEDAGDVPGLPTEKYVVVHINRLLPSASLARLGSILREHCRSKGLALVLLPLAGTHLDIDGLRQLRDAVDHPSVLIELRDTRQMAAVMAKASLYIGVSFHGAITAIAHGVTAIAFNYMHHPKTTDLYSVLGMNTLYSESVDELESCLTNLDSTDNRDSVRPLEEAKHKIEEHFDRVANWLRPPQSGSERRRAPQEKLTTPHLLDETVRTVIKLQYSLADATQKIDWLEQYATQKIDWLEGYATREIDQLGERLAATVSARTKRKTHWALHRIGRLLRPKGQATGQD